jgi:hypothetical protein
MGARVVLEVVKKRKCLHPRNRNRAVQPLAFCSTYCAIPTPHSLYKLGRNVSPISAHQSAAIEMQGPIKQHGLHACPKATWDRLCLASEEQSSAECIIRQQARRVCLLWFMYVRRCSQTTR